MIESQFSVDNLDVEESVNKTLFILESRGIDGGGGNVETGNIFNVVFNKVGPGSYTLPGDSSNVYQIQPKIIGGGGGGGYGIADSGGGGGGGGASYDTNLLNAVINFGILNQPFKAVGGTKITYNVGAGGKGGIFSSKTNPSPGEASYLNYNFGNEQNDLSLLLLPIICPGGNPGQNGQTGGIGGDGGSGGATILSNILSNRFPGGRFTTDQDNFKVLPSTEFTSLTFQSNFSVLGDIFDVGISAEEDNLIVKKGGPTGTVSIFEFKGQLIDPPTSSPGLFIVDTYINDTKEYSYTYNFNPGSSPYEFNFSSEYILENGDKINIKVCPTGGLTSLTSCIFECYITSPRIEANIQTGIIKFPSSTGYTSIPFGTNIFNNIFIGITGTYEPSPTGFTKIIFEESSPIDFTMDLVINTPGPTGYIQYLILKNNNPIYQSDVISITGVKNNISKTVSLQVQENDSLNVAFRQVVPTGVPAVINGFAAYNFQTPSFLFKNGTTGFISALDFTLSSGGGGGGGSNFGGKGGNGVNIPLIEEYLKYNPDFLLNSDNSLITMLPTGEFSIYNLIQYVLLQGGLPGDNNYINFLKNFVDSYTSLTPIKNKNGGKGGGILNAGVGGIGISACLGGGGGGGFGGGRGGQLLLDNGESTSTYGSGGGGGSSNNGNGGDGANGSISLLITRIQ